VQGGLKFKEHCKLLKNNKKLQFLNETFGAANSDSPLNLDVVKCLAKNLSPPLLDRWRASLHLSSHGEVSGPVGPALGLRLVDGGLESGDAVGHGDPPMPREDGLWEGGRGEGTVSMEIGGPKKIQNIKKLKTQKLNKKHTKN